MQSLDHLVGAGEHGVRQPMTEKNHAITRKAIGIMTPKVHAAMVSSRSPMPWRYSRHLQMSEGGEIRSNGTSKVSPGP